MTNQNSTPLKIISSALGLLVVYFVYSFLKNSRVRLPPSPKGLPLLGNVFQVPIRHYWTWFQDVAKDLDSDVIYLNMAGTSMIVVNSQIAADELFAGRSQNYSDRPSFPMINDLMGFNWNIGFMKYGERWKLRRSIFKKTLHPPAVYAYKPNIERGTRTLLQLLLLDPERFLKWVRYSVGVTILSSTHGIDVKVENDPYMAVAQESINALSEAGTPGAFLVDSIPLLKYVPEWFPGAKFKRQAREWSVPVTAAPHMTFDHVKKAMANGTAKPSLVSRFLEEMAEKDNLTKEVEEAMRDVGGVMLFAGTESASSSISTFLLSMVLHPDQQTKAQAAIDSAIGNNRLPDFSDDGNIPYVEALCREVLRWRPVAPTGIPHYTNKDDEYRGYHIPANSIVIGNSWAILHDTSVYGEDADDFNPDRFMKDGKINPDMPDVRSSFGFGRRSCAGQYMAELNLFMMVASILAVFDITKSRDEHGEEITPTSDYGTGSIPHPVPFKCVITPRSDKAAELIRNSLDTPVVI